MQQPSYPDAPPVEVTQPVGAPPPLGPPRASVVVPPGPPAHPRRAHPLLVIALVLSVLALLVSLVAYVDQRGDARGLATRLDDANARIDDLETELEEIPDLEAILEDLFGDLFEESGLPVPGDGGNGFPFGDLDLLQCLAPAGLAGEIDEVEGTAAEQIVEVADIVAADRELTFTAGEPEPTFLDSAETEDRIVELNEEEYPTDEAELDGRLLELLGAVEPGIDLRELVLDLVAGQVAGFYVPESGELVVRSDAPDAPLGPTEQVTLAHELEHALADQNLELLDADLDAAGADAALAALSVIEGDASLIGQRFALAHLSVEDQVEVSLSPELADAQTQLDAAPYYLARELLFPYLEGMSFVCGHLLDGGWDAVDSLYHDPPASTVEILFPERYGDEPADPRGPGDPGERWDDGRRDTFGAADLLFLFEAPADDESLALDDPRRAASAWAGGEYVLFTDGPDSAVGISLEAVDGDEELLCEAVQEFVTAAELDNAAVRCESSSVRIGIAPDAATAQLLVS